MADETSVIKIEVDDNEVSKARIEIAKTISTIKDQQNALTKAYKDGKISVDEYYQSNSKLEKSLKTQNDALVKLQSTNEKVNTSLKDGAPHLDKLTGGAVSSAQGFVSMTKSALGFIATPIGAVLAAAAAIIGVLVAALKKSEPVLDFFEDILTKITQTATTLIDNLKLVGEIIGNVLVGNLGAAATGFGKLTDEISANNDEAQRYLDLSREIEDQQIALTISSADTQNQIKALITASKNRNLTFDEQADKINQALALEKNLTAQRVDLAQKEAQTEIAKIALTRSVRQEQNETLEQFVLRLTQSGDFAGEEAQKIADFYAKSRQAASETLAFQEKAQNQLDAIADKREADRQKQLAAKELQDTIDQAQAAALSRKDEDDQAYRLSSIEQETTLRVDGAQKAMAAAQAALNAKIAAGDKERADLAKTQQLNFLVNQQKLSNASTVFGQISSLLDKESAAYKVLAISQASIDTYRAATLALATYPPPFGEIAAAVSVAIGLANVAKIAGFAEGGYTGGGTKYQPAGIVHANEYVIPSETVNRFGASYFDKYLPGYADGGLVTNQSTSDTNNQMALLRAIKLLPAPVIGFKEMNEFQNQIDFKQTLTTR